MKNGFIRERYLQTLLSMKDTCDMVKVITGLRRSGKSVILKQYIDRLQEAGIDSADMIYINLELLKYAPLKNETALHEHIQEKRKQARGDIFYVFLDEIQEVENWELAVNSLRAEGGFDVYITGSNAKLLSGELATHLAGRYFEVPVYPLSYQEFKAWNDQEPFVKEGACFQKYLEYGGMPYLVSIQNSPELIARYMEDLVNSILLKDIIKRNNVRSVDLLERILAYILQNAGNTFSSTSIHKYLKSQMRSVSMETILNYLRFFCEAFLVYQVPRNDVKGKQILKTEEKYYLADHAFSRFYCHGDPLEIQCVLENIVCLELLRRGWQVSVGKMGQSEIDFVAQKREKKMYIQVCYLLASKQTIEREFGVFDAIQDNYPKYVLSMDTLDFSRDGIIHQNIEDFLLQDSL